MSIFRCGCRAADELAVSSLQCFFFPSNKKLLVLLLISVMELMTRLFDMNTLTSTVALTPCISDGGEHGRCELNSQSFFCLRFQGVAIY